MAINSHDVALSYGMEKATSTLAFKAHPYGIRGYLPDGRAFRYSFSDGALEAGLVCQAAAQPHAGELDMDVPISSDGAAIGERNVLVDLTTGLSTILAADEYRDGLLYVNDGPGEGHIYRISSHSSQTSDFTTAMPFTLDYDDEVRSTGLTSLSLIGLIKNQYKDVVTIDNPTVTYTNVLGATPAAIADNRNFWLQTWGPCALLITAKLVVPILGKAVQPNITTSDLAGSVTGYDTVNSTDTAAEPLNDTPIIGYSMAVAAVDTDHGLVFLQILA
jgi:hypothetical protein